MMPDRVQNVRTMSAAQQYATMVTLIVSQGTQVMGFGAGIASAAAIAPSLGASVAGAAWIVSSYSMTQGTFVLIGGRLGDIFGYKLVFLTGAAWWVVWTLASGFSTDIIMMCVFRALSGIGGGLVIPNAVALLAHVFPPGKKRNIAFGLFGAMGPIGAAGGSILAALFVQLTPWKYAFVFMAALGAVVYTAVFFVVPSFEPADKGGKIDWVGAYLGVAGLILFNFVWNQAPLVGWKTPYEYVLLVVSLFHLGLFCLWETRIAPAPILPFDIWSAPSFPAVILSALFSFMAFGICIWYTVMWCLNVRHMTLISGAAAVQPLTVCGAAAAFVAAFFVPRLSAQHILAIGGTVALISNIILSRMPPQQIYWQTVFPAMALISFCPDFVFTASQIISSNSVKRSQQGVAGSLIATLLNYGISSGVGFGGTVERYIRNGDDLVSGYRGALYLGAGFGGMALFISEVFIRGAGAKRVPGP